MSRGECYCLIKGFIILKYLLEKQNDNFAKKKKLSSHDKIWSA